MEVFFFLSSWEHQGPYAFCCMVKPLHLTQAALHPTATTTRHYMLLPFIERCSQRIFILPPLSAEQPWNAPTTSQPQAINPGQHPAKKEHPALLAEEPRNAHVIWMQTQDILCHSQRNEEFPASWCTQFVFILASKTQVTLLHLSPSSNLISEIKNVLLKHITCESYLSFWLLLIRKKK